MEAHLTLWGIYGKLEGDHDALISHLPLFRCDTVFYAALTPDWTLTPSALLQLDSPDEAALVGTPLKLAHSTTINPGQILSVMGPNFVRSVETLGVSTDPFFAADDWFVAQDSFRVRATTRAELDEHWERLTLQALHAFDAELRVAAGRSVSRRADAALSIFRISPFCNRDQRFWRVATTRRIKGDADGYNRSLLLAAAELKRPFAELDEEVRSWVRTILYEEPKRERQEHFPNLKKVWVIARNVLVRLIAAISKLYAKRDKHVTKKEDRTDMAKSLDETLRTAFADALYPKTSIFELYPSISFERLSTIEKDLIGLTEVVVIADVLDDPGRAEYKDIYDAMQNNFMEGVQYSFLISPDHFDDRRDEFMRYFRAIYTKALCETPPTGAKSRIRASSFEGLCRIFRLHRPWGLFPYIFYTVRSNGQNFTIAYRGSDVQHGLSSCYYEVASPEAMAILHTCAMTLEEDIFNSVVPKPKEITIPSNSNVRELFPAA